MAAAVAASLILSPPLLPRTHSSLPSFPVSSLPRRRRRIHLPPIPVASPAAPTPISDEAEGSETLSLESDTSPPDTDTFSWRDHWYPVSLVEDLNPRLPTAFRLLNRDLVLWNDPKTGDWVAFDDLCPHRLAPLSEGRIDEDGCLQCSYHGWSFDGSGSCTKIPQASAEGPEARAIRSPRACVAKLPTLVSQGLLFVWPDENGWDKASKSEPPMLPDDFNDPAFSTVSIQRDLFYGYDTLMENVSDPSHIEFAHHKKYYVNLVGLIAEYSEEMRQEHLKHTYPNVLLQYEVHKPVYSVSNPFYSKSLFIFSIVDPDVRVGSLVHVTGRRDRAKPLPFKMESSGAWGYAGSNDGNPRISAKFIAPCYAINKIEIDTKLPFLGDQKWVVWICSFNIPMAPGQTRSIVCSARNFFQFTMPGPAWWQLVPRWYEHWTSNKVYDGDMIVLQGQEKIFLSKSMEASADVNQQYTKITFTPTQADRLVLAFRNWLRRYGNSQPDWFGYANQQALPSTVLSKRQMLDRFEQHTLKCSSCKGAYEAFQTLQKFFIGATVVLCACAGIPPQVLLRVLLAGAALVTASLAYALHESQKNFVFVDYVHAEID